MASPAFSFDRNRGVRSSQLNRLTKRQLYERLPMEVSRQRDAGELLRLMDTGLSPREGLSANALLIGQSLEIKVDLTKALQAAEVFVPVGPDVTAAKLLELAVGEVQRYETAGQRYEHLRSVSGHGPRGTMPLAFLAREEYLLGTPEGRQTAARGFEGALSRAQVIWDQEDRPGENRVSTYADREAFRTYCEASIEALRSPETLGARKLADELAATLEVFETCVQEIGGLGNHLGLRRLAHVVRGVEGTEPLDDSLVTEARSSLAEAMRRVPPESLGPLF